MWAGISQRRENWRLRDIRNVQVISAEESEIQRLQGEACFTTNTPPWRLCLAGLPNQTLA